MFSVPQAKRVRREELYSPSRSPLSSPDPEIHNLLREAFLREHQLEEIAVPLNSQRDLPAAKDEAESGGEFEFRLFAAPSKSENGTIARIRVQSPSAGDRPPGLVGAPRPNSYYFQETLSSEAEQELQCSAMSGAEIIALSRKPWPGCSLPWRVITIPPTGTSKSVTGNNIVDQNDLPRKKRRKGKKARTYIRKKMAAEWERLAKEQMSVADKELAERAKRARRNREKKLKKRERDKAKKALIKENGDGTVASSAEISDHEETTP